MENNTPDSCCNSCPPAANWSEFKTALPLALAFIAAFVLLQKLGIVDVATTGSVSYGTAFFVGLIASLSTCMAVVGGLVLSMSATFAQSGTKARSQVLFHAGRLISFFILGGVVGAVGSAFSISIRASAILGIIVGLVMLVLGLNLLDVFGWARKLQPSLPKSLSRFAVGASRLNSSATPFLVGVLTFFLPCGFTQSMQIYALGTGSFVTGAFIMLAFALGTLPVLAIMSATSSHMKESPRAGVFFKTAGLVVIMFAVFNMVNSFSVVTGAAGFAVSREVGEMSFATSSNVTIENGVQVVTVAARGGYSPRLSVAKAGLPTVIRMRTSGAFDCSSSVAIPSLGVWKSLAFSGDTDITIPSQKATGRLDATCSMGMYRFAVDFK